MADSLITTYLEMTHYEQFRPAYVEDADVTLLALRTLDLEYYRFLYRVVGELWMWRDRTMMSDETLAAQLIGADIRVLYVGGAPAGYVELGPMSEDGSMEIAYFGLRERFFGRGLGKHLLSCGVQAAWDYGAKRVWVHTCNLDGPHALDNYIKRGFSVYQVTDEPMPEAYR
jgi:GNAT superfamily N-acetyltransferase